MWTRECTTNSEEVGELAQQGVSDMHPVVLQQCGSVEIICKIRKILLYIDYT